MISEGVRATVGEVEHALKREGFSERDALSVRQLTDALADHGMRIERIGPDSCEDDPRAQHEPVMLRETE